MMVVNSPELFRCFPRKKLMELVHDGMKAEDVIVLCYDYIFYFNAMYRDLRWVQSATSDEIFHDQLSDQIRKNGEWKAFLKNLIAWYRESPRSERLPKIFLDHAASIDHSINKYHLAIREWDSAVWEGRDKPSRFQRERHELPHHEGSQLQSLGRRQHRGQDDHRAHRNQDRRDRRYQHLQQRRANHYQHDTRDTPEGQHREQRRRPSGLEAWGFRAWPTSGDLRQQLDRGEGRRRCASVQPVPRYDHAPRNRDS
jgi:hypothetical protein